MKQIMAIAIGLTVAFGSNLQYAQDPGSQDPSSTGEKKRRGGRPSSSSSPDDGSSSAGRRVRENKSSEPKTSSAPKSYREPKQPRSKSFDPMQNSRRARQELENQTTVFGDSATKRYYRFRCNPYSGELLMMSLSEARRLGMRGENCPTK